VKRVDATRLYYALELVLFVVGRLQKGFEQSGTVGPARLLFASTAFVMQRSSSSPSPGPVNRLVRVRLMPSARPWAGQCSEGSATSGGFARR
jgi:hypothetical protein